MKFLQNESVTLTLLFSSAALYVAATSPSGIANALVVAGLASVWTAIAMMIVNRL